VQNTSDDLGFPVASSSCSCADSLQSSAPRPRRSGSFGITLIAGRKRIDNKLCLLVHKALVGHAPQYIADMITQVADLLAAVTSSFHEPTARLVTERLLVAAPRAWNQLPTDLKLQQSTTAFQRHLKTCLFNRAFCSDDTV